MPPRLLHFFLSSIYIVSSQLLIIIYSYPFSSFRLYKISSSIRSSIMSSSSSSSAFSKLRRKLSPRRSDKDKANNNSLSSTPTPASPPSPISSNCSDELQRVFNYFDENGDGMISPAELQSCVRTLGGELSIEDAEAAVGSSDTDGDGLLGIEDFLKLMESNCSAEEKKEELKQAFDMYESEPGSGFISPSSLKRMLKRLGESRSVDDCKAMIRSFDLNGDGVLSFNEFSIMMR